MSHRIGTHQTLSPTVTIGPDSGSASTSANTWLFTLAPAPAPTGTRFVILHFSSASFPANNRLEVDLGYDMDVFLAVDGPDFWTRPVNMAGGTTVAIRYITDGSSSGHVVLGDYGRAESLESDIDGTADYHNVTNPDIFLLNSPYVEPLYELRGFSGSTPNWENVACVSPGDVQAAVARSVGIFVMVEFNTEVTPATFDMSSCSGTLIGPDLVLCAGHCLTSPDKLDALSGSFCFDYQTNCDGSRPAGYNPKFHKILREVKRAYSAGLDYSIIQLKTLPGVPPVTMRTDLPAVGDPVFEIHHPQGIPKKVSARHSGPQATISSIETWSNFLYVFANTDLTGGSSGSALFDMSGRILGIADKSGHSKNGFLSITEVMKDISVLPAPPKPRDVMLVMDRSGSMSLDAGTGRTRIVEAQDAASLFVQLIRTGAGDRVGLVSFSTTASTPVDFELSTVNAGTKNSLIGPAPFSGGIVGGLAPGGLTSIGKGLAVAQSQFPPPGPSANLRTILLLTDGLENTAPMIADMDSSLGGDDLSVIGLGSESSLNGVLLNSLAEAHGGVYTRAGDGLKLRKFFALAYGNIFESGTLTDPEFFLPASQTEATPLSFLVCSEDVITVVIGWDRVDAPLMLSLTAPGGTTVTSGTAGTESSSGKTWTFLRVPLPILGERSGTWKVVAFRPGGGEFPPPAVDLRYFVNVVVKGGPRLSRVKPRSQKYHTGDTINPLFMIKNNDGTVPDNAMIKVTVTRPANSAGTLLSAAQLGPGSTIDGDAIPARQATLLGIEKANGKPAVTYVDETFELFDDGGHDDGGIEPDGIFGNPLPELLKAEGHYTFHAFATFGMDCASAREVVWTTHVDTGIDPGKTTATTAPLGPGSSGGGSCVRMTFTPRDRYGNLLGPGRSDAFSIEPQPGSTPYGPVQDMGDGSYQVTVCSDPDSLEPPKIGISQPGRPPVVIVPPNFKLFVYSVPFLCGEQADDCCGCSPVRPGRYATEINIHNPGEKIAPVLKRAIPLVFAGTVAGREPTFKAPLTTDGIRLPPHTATMDDCCRLLELLLGAPPAGPVPLTMGVLEVVSTVELSVTAVYTASDGAGCAPSIDVKQISVKVLTL